MFEEEGVMAFARRLLIGAALVLAFAPGPAAAQDYPRQPIKIIVPLAAGGMADIFARTFAQKVGEATGATIVVENRTGGGGAIGADAVAKAPADGYTLLMGFHAVLTILPQLGGKLPYDPSKDFTPVALVAGVPNVLVVNPALPVKSVKELVDYAKANPGKITYASQGNGSTGHMAGEQFRFAAGVDIVHVPYRGAAPAIQDLVAGHTAMMFDILSLAIPQIKDGKMRALAIATPQRAKVVPDLPTMAEAGYPGVEGGPWFGLVAPAGTPQPAIEWLNREARKAFAAPDVRDRFNSQGVEFALGSAQDFAAYIAADYKRWGDVIRRADIKLH
jgi:tripartite-type tricarboxylate transporter receptor subunit TctC